jgi:uncharacterized membrane protein YgcG
VHVQLVNYKADKTPFLNDLQITPLRSPLGELTHVLGILQEVKQAPGYTCALASGSSSGSSGGSSSGGSSSGGSSSSSGAASSSSADEGWVCR